MKTADQIKTEIKTATANLFDLEQNTLRKAFDRVANSNDWRAPIDAVVVVLDDAELEDIRDAVEFFTATQATITLVDGRTYRVQADGYRRGPAGDH